MKKLFSLIVFTELVFWAEISAAVDFKDFARVYQVVSCKLQVNMAPVDTDAMCDISQIRVQSVGKAEISIAYIAKNGQVFYREVLNVFDSQSGDIRDRAQFESGGSSAQWVRRYRESKINRHVDEMRRFVLIENQPGKFHFISSYSNVLTTESKFSRHDYELSEIL